MLGNGAEGWPIGGCPLPQRSDLLVGGVTGALSVEQGAQRRKPSYGWGMAHNPTIWSHSRHRGSGAIHKAAARCCGHHLCPLNTFSDSCLLSA